METDGDQGIDWGELEKDLGEDKDEKTDYQSGYAVKVEQSTEAGATET